MKERITVVLEYASRETVPRIGAGFGANFGDCKVIAIQFNDALRELEYLSEHCDCDPDVRHAAFKSGEQGDSK